MKVTLKALASDDERGRVLTAPTVGCYMHAPPPGTHLAPGASLGSLRVLRRTYELLVPPEGAGVVREVLVPDRGAPVERGQALLVLAESGEVVAFEAGDAGPAVSTEEEIPEGQVAVRAPTEGIFYSRPDPESPSFVDEGDIVERGKVLGLVEVMKCFNQIVYGAPDMPPKARVTRVISSDSDEVKLGQALFLVEPL
jgi:biotin carboxyl carrier protein